MWRLGGRRCRCPRALTGQVGKHPGAVGFVFMISHTIAIHERTQLGQLLCCGNRDPPSPGRTSRRQKQAGTLALIVEGKK